MLKNVFTYIVRQLKKTFSQAYVTSLVIAFLLWALIKFSALYQERVVFNLKLNHLPESYILLSNSSHQITCSIKTTGFRILLLKYWESETVEIDFEDLVKVSPLEYHYSLEEIGKSNKPNWMKNATEIQFENSTVVFNVEELEQKRVRVNPKVKLSFKQGYILDQVDLNIDSVDVLLPKSQIYIQDVYTYTKTIKDISKSENIELSIDLPDSWKLVNHSNKIECMILVDQLTQGSVSLPIEKENGVDIKFFPGRVEVKYSIPSKQFNTINAQDIIVEVESPYSEYEKNEALKVHVTSKPEDVQILSINPSEVEFLIFDNE